MSSLILSLISGAILLCLLSMPPLHARDSYSDFERGLNLSREQKVRMEEIRNRYIDEWHSSRQEIIRKQIEIKDLSGNPHRNQDQIDKLSSEIENMSMKRENLYNQYRDDVSRILDEKQKEKFDSFSNSERRRSMGRRGMKRYGR